MLNILTQHAAFSFCGKLVGHLPVVKWLRVVNGGNIHKKRSSGSHQGLGRQVEQCNPLPKQTLPVAH